MARSRAQSKRICGSEKADVMWLRPQVYWVVRHDLRNPVLVLSDMKRQYTILAVVLIGALALSLWAASHVNMNDIERSLTNSSGDEHDSLVEGNLPLYLGTAVALFVIAIGSFVYLSKH